MSEVLLDYYWSDYHPPGQRFEPGRWGVSLVGDHTVNQLRIYIHEGLNYRLSTVDEVIQVVEDCMAGRAGPGWVLGDNDGGGCYGVGHFLFASGYDDESRVLVTADVLMGILQRVRALITDPRFTDPEASGFETMVVPIVATGPEAFDVYYSLGGTTGDD